MKVNTGKLWMVVQVVDEPEIPIPYHEHAFSSEIEAHEAMSDVLDEDQEMHPDDLEVWTVEAIIEALVNRTNP